jgi:hypothetical protein
MATVADAPPNLFVRINQELRARSVWIVGAALLVAVPWMFVTTSKVGEWHECYLPAARLMRDGQSIAANSSNYTYPPAMALFTIPMAFESLAMSRFVWSLVNVAAVFALFVSCWRLIGGSSLGKLPKSWSAVFLVTLLLAARWVVSPLQHLQFDAVIAGVLCVGCLAVARGRDLLGGALVGLAASMKVTPMLFLPYLMWRGRWKAAAGLIFVAVGVNFVPDLLYPQAGGGSYCVDWYRKYLATTLGGTTGSWHTAVHLNQSLAGFFNRMAGIWTTGSTENLSIVKFDDATQSVVKLLNYGAAAFLLGITLAVGRRPFRGPSDGADRRSAEVRCDSTDLLWTAEFGMLACLMILLSPMSGKAHYVVLLLPTLAAIRDAVQRPTFGTRLTIAVLLVTGLLCCKEFLGPKLGDETLIWGLPTLYPLILLTALWSLHARIRRDESANDPQIDSPLFSEAGPLTRRAA